MERRTKIVHRNLKLCSPKISKRGRRRTVMKNFESVGMDLVETGMIWFWPDHRIIRWTEVIDMKRIHDVQAQKRGILLVGIRFLTLEPDTRQFGVQEPRIGVYRPNDNPLIDWLQTWGCLRLDGSMLNRRDLKGVIKALKKGEVIWYTPDHDCDPCSSAFVPLFVVEQAATTTGTWMLARMSGACLVPFVPRRKPGDKGYQLTILPPECSPLLDDTETTAAWMNKVVEKYIMMAPEQYIWLCRRFKTRLKGVPSRY